MTRVRLRPWAACATIAIAGATAFAAATPATAAPTGSAEQTTNTVESVDPTVASDLDATDRDTLLRYATDTWASMAAMTDPVTGLTADNIEGDLDPASASGYTSQTNIGGYLWSAVSARDLGIITADEAHDRIATTLHSLESMEKHEPSGMFYNWYSPADASKLTVWPDDGNVVEPFISTVDNGWLATALRVVSAAEPSLAPEADALYDAMDFGFFHDPEGLPGRGVGLNRGGFWVDEPSGCSVVGNYAGEGPDVYYTCHHYDTTVSEARIANYIGIAKGEIEPGAYYGTYRTMPDSCDYGWQEQKPIGTTQNYNGVEVFEGAYSYAGMSLVPAWGGSMFEALMPDLFVPEAEWGPESWGLNHPLTVAAQRIHGLDEADYGYWGFSPASNPFGGYSEYGVDEIGINSEGYFPDVERTDVDKGFAGCREGTNATPEFGEGVVTPHASFLALAYEPAEALDNLAGIADELGAYGSGGFYDAVSTDSATIAERYLSLDQSMIMAATTNVLLDDRVKSYFVDDAFTQTIEPLVAAQKFSASAAVDPEPTPTPTPTATATSVPVPTEAPAPVPTQTATPPGSGNGSGDAGAGGSLAATGAPTGALPLALGLLVAGGVALSIRMLRARARTR